MTKEDKLRILSEAFNTLRKDKVIRTWKEFADLLGVNKNGLSEAKNGNERSLTDNLIEKVQAVMNDKYGQGTPSVAPQPSSAQYAPSLVPTIPFKVYNETGVDLQEYIVKNVVPMGPAIAQFATTDLHMFVSNDEMKPHLRSGDVLSLKRVSEEAPIVNGEIYVINSYYLGLTVRFVFDRGTHYELKSSNEWYEPFNLPKEQVFGIYRILGLVRTNI